MNAEECKNSSRRSTTLMPSVQTHRAGFALKNWKIGCLKIAWLCAARGYTKIKQTAGRGVITRDADELILKRSPLLHA
jgi:hypothetical protein